LLQGGRRLEAARTLEHLHASVTSPAFLSRIEFFLGQCYGELGDTDRQLATCRRAVDRDPLSGPLRLAWAAALADAGRGDEAAVEYWQALSGRNPPAVGWGMLVRLLIRRTLDTPPARRDWSDLKHALDLASRAAPEAVELPLLRALALRLQNQPERARAVLDAARIQFPERPEVPAALADLAGSRGDSDGALGILDEAKRRLGDQVELRLARARCWAGQGSPEAALRLGELERDADKFSAPDQAQLFGGLADLYARSGDSRQAQRIWERLARTDPYDLRSRLQLLDCALRDEDESSIGRLVEEVRRIEGEDGSLWRYGEAVHNLALARRGNRDGITNGRRCLAEVASRRHSWSRLPLLAAHFDELEGEPKQALEDYLQAIELGEHEATVIRRAAELLAKQGHAAEAERLLSRLQR
jgi:tetratricopeptide (TPR) repeat protein